MRLSVVIPAYNEERYIGRLLTSLQQQTYKKPFEIIVVDNNSTDKTAQIAKSFGVRVVKEKNRGYAHACNRGFFEAKGKIIARADADHVVPPTWLEKIVEKFEKDKKLIAVGGPIYPLESSMLENLLYYPSQLSWMYMLKLCGRGFLFPNMAVLRKKFLECGGFDTTVKFGEDTNLCYRLKKLGKVTLFPSMYAYSSVRRLESMGVVNFIVNYALINEVHKSTGQRPSTGLEIVRKLPSKPPRPDNPLPYLIATPAMISLSTFFLAYTIFSYTTIPLPQSARKEIIKLMDTRAKLYSFSKVTFSLPAQITPYLQQYSIFKFN